MAAANALVAAKQHLMKLQSRLHEEQERAKHLDETLNRLRSKSKPRLNYIIRDGWLQTFESKLPVTHEEDPDDYDLGPCPWSSVYQTAGRRDEMSQVQGSYGVFECGSVKVADSSTKFINLSSKVRLAKWVRKLQNTPFTICPSSGWLRWDLEIENVEEFRKQITNEVEEGAEFLRDVSPTHPWVIKKDGASGGNGIVFVSNLQQVKKALDEGRDLEEALPFLDDRRESIANWAAQRHIDKPMLLMDGHKFHLRAYVVGVGNRVFHYSRFEVRVAPVKWESDFAVKGCHITNGGGSDAHHERRYLADQFPELAPAVAKLPEYLRYIVTHCQEPETAEVPDASWTACAVMGLDIMVDVDYNLYLLEANHSPAAPPFDELHRFGCHVRRFCQRLVRLLVIAPQGGTVPGFNEIVI